MLPGRPPTLRLPLVPQQYRLHPCPVSATTIPCSQLTRSGISPLRTASRSKRWSRPTPRSIQNAYWQGKRSSSLRNPPLCRGSRRRLRRLHPRRPAHRCRRRPPRPLRMWGRHRRQPARPPPEPAPADAPQPEPAPVDTAGAGPAPEPAPPSRRSPRQPSGWQAEILELINGKRIAQGLAALTWSPELAGAAQAHADDCAQRNQGSHVGSDGAKLAARLARVGYAARTSSENWANAQSVATCVRDVVERTQGPRPASPQHPEPAVHRDRDRRRPGILGLLFRR